MVPDSGSSIHSSEAAFPEERAHSVIFLQGVLLSHCGRENTTIQMQVDIQYENLSPYKTAEFKKKNLKAKYHPIKWVQIGRDDLKINK